MVKSDEAIAWMKRINSEIEKLANRLHDKQNLFGKGENHPRFKDFIGDYLAIGISDVSIFNSREEANHFIGVHAGMTEKEMMVPLIIIEKIS